MAEAIWAEFERADDMTAALHDLHDRGHTALEAFSPFTVTEAFSTLEYEEAFGPIRVRPTLLPWVALVFGVLGGSIGYFWQWFTNAFAYPQNAGGRPANAVPAFMFNTFETLVLVGSCATFFALLFFLRFPRLYDPRETIDGFRRTTDDRFGLLVRDPPPWLVPEETERVLREHGAADVRRVALA